MVTLQLRQLTIPPGQRLLIQNVSWQEFENILAELGDHRGLRVAYYKGELELRMPLPKHEKAKVMISYLLTALLEELDMDWESLGSSTFKSKEMAAGIEPDDCFYIQNHALMIGKERLDLTVDPPPDLAIEVDVTSTTQVNAYEALKVSEIWRYSQGRLQIFVLQDGKYEASQISPSFPNFPVIEGISRFVEMSRTAGTRPALKEFRNWVKDIMAGDRC
ncbi:Uma2 family endonuclease [Kovacikia minuta CCNUW1]|uniref:Uma2 family endonuclease n=1 Tax=Kovacikia minuta TaxID=2931930 RepID=UPI001CCED0BB|nr:Uma2 family endonuclease [Kovacikia minuta]UBF27963.1 Uma2 family endonuclease [Kovacikia minuta CCNUW1]